MRNLWPPLPALPGSLGFTGPYPWQQTCWFVGLVFIPNTRQVFFCPGFLVTNTVLLYLRLFCCLKSLFLSFLGCKCVFDVTHWSNCVNFLYDLTFRPFQGENSALQINYLKNK